MLHTELYIANTQNRAVFGINVIVILSSIILITIPQFSIIGELAFWLYLLLKYIVYLKNHKWQWSFNLRFVPIISLLLAWMFVRSQNLYGIRNFILFAILMIVHITNIPYKKLSKRLLLVFGALVAAISVMLKITGEFYTNTNIGAIISAIIVLLIFFYFPKYRIVTAILGIGVISIYETRSVLLAIFVSFSTVSLVKYKLCKLRTILLLLFSLIGIGLYLMWDIIMSPEFNAFIHETTNKNLQSGRELIWGAIFEYMHGIDWLIGVGGGVHHSSIVPEIYKNMSIHSTYIYMLFHYGGIGLSLLLILFYKILNWLIIKKYYYSAFLFLLFALRDFFEITLVNNQMIIAILFWGWISNGWIEKSKKQRYSINQLETSCNSCVKNL